jgi:hypothetical protein
VDDAHKKGFLPTNDLIGRNLDELEEHFFPRAHYYVGTNSRGVSKRGKKLLGWSPYRPKLVETIPALVDSEARLLGLTQGHAAAVSS